MKLYFYFLENKGIKCEECEVEEKQKTYKPVDGFPRGYYGSYVNKEHIGVMKAHYQKVVIFTEPSFEKAKDMFSDYLSGIINSTKKDLEEYEEQLKYVVESEG